MESLAELRTLIDRCSFDPTFAGVIPRINLLRSEAATACSPILYYPVLCIIAQGSRRITLGGDVFEYDERSYLVAGAILPARAAIIEGSPDRPFFSAGLLLGLRFNQLATSRFGSTGERNRACACGRHGNLLS